MNKNEKNATIKKMFMKIELENIVKPLLDWYQISKRDLPWRHTTNSYNIWISEIMLQQTRVEAVKDYYQRFLKELPTIEELAKVEEDKLLKLWEGLGYYSRARNLKKCAQMVIESGKVELPRNYEELKKLPGIGPYAAGSIGSIAYGLKTPAIDGNVLRVMSRILEDDRDILNNKVRQEYFEKLSKIMPENSRDFTESLMELGALVCLPNGEPKCNICPLAFCCQGYQHQTMLNFPVKKKLNKRTIEKRTILILEYQNTIAIQKRPSTGLLASLYEFFSLENQYEEEALKNKLAELGIEWSEIKELGIAKHIFSHKEWHMIGYYIKCNQKPSLKLTWVTKEELQNDYSLPSAFSYYAKTFKK